MQIYNNTPYQTQHLQTLLDEVLSYSIEHAKGMAFKTSPVEQLNRRTKQKDITHVTFYTNKQERVNGCYTIYKQSRKAYLKIGLPKPGRYKHIKRINGQNQKSVFGTAVSAHAVCRYIYVLLELCYGTPRESTNTWHRWDMPFTEDCFVSVYPEETLKKRKIKRKQSSHLTDVQQYANAITK
jgi:hypothetical protein